MANIKGQMKRNLQNEKRRVANSAFRSSLKSAIKNVEVSVENNNKETATTTLVVAFKKLDKALAKGIHNKNYVSRTKSRLSKLVNGL
jgi:small subunit ribosomal protein S20